MCASAMLGISEGLHARVEKKGKVSGDISTVELVQIQHTHEKWGRFIMKTPTCTRTKEN